MSRHTKYYDFLGVPTSATSDEIRKAYRKLAAKLHPDKSTGNKEKFQELQNIYEILGDEEKRNLYDSYGEEGIRKGVVYERPEAFNQQDLFDLFNQHGNGFFFEFNGFGGQQRFRRRRNNQNENEEPVHRPNAMFAQILPLLIIFIVYILPYLFESSPVYSFEKTSEYYIKRKTPIKAVYFVKDGFDSKYDLSSMSDDDRRIFNKEINYKYLEYLQNKCAKVMRQKQEINYKLYYYKNYPRYVDSFQRELKNLDYHYCEKYNEFSNYVR